MVPKISVHSVNSDNILTKTISFSSFFFVLVGCLVFFVVQGCASVDTQTYPQGRRGAILAKPDKLFVYDFAVSPGEVTLDDGIGEDVAKVVKGTEGTPKAQMELELGRKVAVALSENLVIELGKYGILAERTSAPPPSQGQVLIVKGQFLSIDEGNATQRMVIGFGLGRSVVRAHGQVYEVSPKGNKFLSDFFSEVKSSRKPGMGPMVGVGAVAGTAATAAAVSGGLGVTAEMADALPFSASLVANVKKMAKDLAERAARFYVKQAWLPLEALD